MGCGLHTELAVVTRALAEFIACREQRTILDLAGIDWDDLYAYKA